MNIHKAPNPAQVRVDIFFGMNIPNNGGEITTREFMGFLADYVTPQFPGFTVACNLGYWKGEAEEMRQVTILAADADSLRHSVRQIAERYKTEFKQEAVAYSFTPCEFTLDCWPYGPTTAYHKPGKGY